MARMLTSTVEIPKSLDSSSEDIFNSAIDLIFPDETRNFHGSSGSHVIYKSRQFGNVKLGLAAPESEDGRKLFAHYLWNAGLLLAEFLEAPVQASDTDASTWDIRGHRVLELGAGR